MRKQAVPALMILSLMVALAVTPANAQSSSHFVRIRVPFEFTIKDKTLPPGEYIVKRSVSGSPEMLSIRSVDGDSGEYVLTSNVQAGARRSESKLVFHRYGGQYFLSQVWTAGDSAGRELPKSRRERGVERETAKSAMERQTVTLVVDR